MKIRKITDRLLTGLSTAEKTGPVLFADHFFSAELERTGFKRKSLEYAFTSMKKVEGKKVKLMVGFPNIAASLKCDSKHRGESGGSDSKYCRY
eukprot:3740363-Pleurochrysis_carterae.AAC.1